MRTRLALVSALTVLATVTTAQAAGKSTGKKPTKMIVNPLSVAPAVVKVGGTVHITGTKFGVNKKVRILVYCPMWNAKVKPAATLSARTNRAGRFAITYRAPAIAKKTRFCNVYALNTAGKTSAWDAMAFSVKRSK